MTDRRLLELETIAASDDDLDLQEACIEIRRAHERIAKLLDASPQEIERERFAELFNHLERSREALEAATFQAMAMARNGGQPCQG